MTLTTRLAGAALAAFCCFVLSANANAQGRSYRIIGVGDIMMGSNFPTPVMHPKLKFGVKPAELIGEPLARLMRTSSRASAPQAITSRGLAFGAGIGQADLAICCLAISTAVAASRQ